LQSAAKAAGLPWDTGKAFDHSAPLSALLPAALVDPLGSRSIRLDVNGQTRQLGHLRDLIWDVGEILHELSKLFALKAGDLIFMGTPAGVAPLVPGDTFVATLDDILELRGRILPAA
ncbi:MAG: FAA hydrolase family protein, partial [Lysobacter sp.]